MKVRQFNVELQPKQGSDDCIDKHASCEQARDLLDPKEQIGTAVSMSTRIAAGSKARRGWGGCWARH